MDEALASLQERGSFLDACCAALGREPAGLDRVYFAGFAEEFPFASAEALHDFLGRYRQAGTRRFIFMFGDEADGGRFATRDTIEAFAADILRETGG